MAKKRQKTEDRVKFGEYLTERVDFNDAERLEINNHLEANRLDVRDALLRLLDESWSVRFSWTDFNLTYQVTLTQARRSHQYGGLVLLLNHPDLEKLEQVFAYFALFVLLPGKYRNRAALSEDNW